MPSIAATAARSAPAQFDDAARFETPRWSCDARSRRRSRVDRQHARCGGRIARAGALRGRGEGGRRRQRIGLALVGQKAPPTMPRRDIGRDRCAAPRASRSSIVQPVRALERRLALDVAHLLRVRSATSRPPPIAHLEIGAELARTARATFRSTRPAAPIAGAKSSRPGLALVR